MESSEETYRERLTHLDERGEARMIDVGGKGSTRRYARAEAWVRMSERAFRALETGTLAKGDALAVARVAGIMAAKRTHELIPLCHPLGLTSVSVVIELDAARYGARVETEAHVNGPTGVEMEALTAATVAALTLYDMVKGVDKGTVIEHVRLVEKRGGAGGEWHSSL